MKFAFDGNPSESFLQASRVCLHLLGPSNQLLSPCFLRPKYSEQMFEDITCIHTFTLTCVQYSSCRSSERDVCCAGGCCVSSSCCGTPRSLPAPRRACWTLAGQAWTKNCAKSPITRGGQCFSLLTLRAPPALPAVSFLTMTWEAWRAGRADGCVSLCAGEFSLCESQSGDECDAVNAETGCTASRSYLFSTVRVCKRLPTLTAYHAYRYTG